MCLAATISHACASMQPILRVLCHVRMQVDSGYADELVEQIEELRTHGLEVCRFFAVATCPPADQPRAIRASLDIFSALSLDRDCFKPQGWSDSREVQAQIEFLWCDTSWMHDLLYDD